MGEGNAGIWLMVVGAGFVLLGLVIGRLERRLDRLEDGAETRKAHP